jgi:hypothetical protein
MMPTELPVLPHPPVLLREFTGADAGLVQSVAGDPLIPLITTVPVSGTAADARAFIARQRGSRLARAARRPQDRRAELSREGRRRAAGRPAPGRAGRRRSAR